MKRSIFIVAITLLLAGCGALAELRPASYVANHSYIGMSVAEFKKLTGGYFSIETMTSEYTVYRTNEWSGSSDHRYISSVKLFHFDSGGRLVRIDSRDFGPSFFPGYNNFEPLNP